MVNDSDEGMAGGGRRELDLWNVRERVWDPERSSGRETWNTSTKTFSRHDRLLDDAMMVDGPKPRPLSVFFFPLRRPGPSSVLVHPQAFLGPSSIHPGLSTLPSGSPSSLSSLPSISSLRSALVYLSRLTCSTPMCVLR